MSSTPALLVVTECYPRPGAPLHCAFAHRQMVGVRSAGWHIEVGVPNGWYPRRGWRLRSAWRDARASAIPPGWSLDGIAVGDLTFDNGWPGRIFARRLLPARIADAIVRRGERLRSANAPVILMAQFALPYGPSVRDAAQRLSMPYVIQLRGDDVWIWPHANAASMHAFVETVRDAHLVIAVSRSLLEEAQRLAGTLRRTAVVPNGIDLATFNPPATADERQRCRRLLGLAQDEIAIVCVGDAIVRKGWLDLLDALGVIPALPQRLVLVAVVAHEVDEIDLASECARRAPRVRLSVHRGLDMSRLADVYRACDLFCLASHWEGMSNALLEAMASGLPCIATAVAGHSEVVASGVDGILVAPKDPASLRNALVSLLASAYARSSMGAAARVRAESVGTSAKAGARLARLLRDVAAGVTDPDALTVDPYAVTTSVPAAEAECLAVNWSDAGRPGGT